MKKILWFLLLTEMMFVIPVHAEVVLYRYFDKLSGEERGISYSDKDGNAPINNPDWNVEIIPESKKEFYVNLYNVQIKQKQQQADNELKQKKNKAKAKLASQGFTQDEIDGIVR